MSWRDDGSSRFKFGDIVVCTDLSAYGANEDPGTCCTRYMVVGVRSGVMWINRRVHTSRSVVDDIRIDHLHQVRYELLLVASFKWHVREGRRLRAGRQP